MGTKTIKLKGKAYWAKLFEENKDMGFENAWEEHGGATTIDLLMTNEEFKKLKDAGSMKRGTLKEDGVNVRLTRKWEGPEWASGAPKVYNVDGSVRTYEEGPIANESEVEVTVSVYTTSRKNIVGTRLDSVKILNEAEMPPLVDDLEDSEVPF